MRFRLNCYNNDQKCLKLLKCVVSSKARLFASVFMPLSSDWLPGSLAHFLDDYWLVAFQASIEITVYLSAASKTSVSSLLSDDLNKKCSWSKHDHNRLVVNWSKTNAMLFPDISHVLFTVNIELRIKDNQIKFVFKFKLLVITLFRELHLDNHVSNVCKKVNQRCPIISGDAYLFPPKFKETLFKSLVISHFAYCSTHFTFIKQSSFKKLEKFFNNL